MAHTPAIEHVISGDGHLGGTGLVTSLLSDGCVETPATPVMGRSHHDQTKSEGTKRRCGRLFPKALLRRRQLSLKALLGAPTTDVPGLPVIGETVENTAPTPILHEEFAPAIKDVEVRPVFEGAMPEPQSGVGADPHVASLALRNPGGATEGQAPQVMEHLSSEPAQPEQIIA